MRSKKISPGLSFPLGASIQRDGVNFSIYSKNATGVELLLYSRPDDEIPQYTIKLDPKINKTFHYWHCFVDGLQNGQIYGYKVYGPNAPELGHRFDSTKVLLDPYCRAIANSSNYSRKAASISGDNSATSFKSVVVDNGLYDWEDDSPPRIPYSESVIYELHIIGFTKHPSSGVQSGKRGTYAGLIEKIPYLKELGVTAVELMPVCQFDKQDAPDNNTNYWGYSPVAFFAPHMDYSSLREPFKAVYEFCDLVKALHRAGIEVILDMVFNHTAEGDHNGPTISFRGLDNSTYYIHNGKESEYANYSGCGNSFKANHPIGQKFIIDCLRYWVTEMHVDGFRFDLASVLSRDIFGNPQPVESSAILQGIESDPVLAGVKLIAEAWDSAGLYQVGSFINASDWYAEWNGPFRDDVRRFIKGDNNTTHRLAERIAGSSDIYLDRDREPNRSVHFVTCHDGFTLNDLVTFNDKHNEENGESNQDGSSDNNSWNCGIEGVTTNSAIEELRIRQIKNFLTVLFFSQGTPMLLMGDEIRRSQNGNNNAYGQNNKLNWFDWALVEQNKELFEFTKYLISFTQSLALMKQDHLMCTSSGSCCCPSISWHGIELNKPDWSEHSHSLAFSIHHPQENERIYIILNAYWKSLEFELPKLPSKQKWHRFIDTSDSALVRQPMIIHDLRHTVKPRSSVVLMAQGEIHDKDDSFVECIHDCS